MSVSKLKDLDDIFIMYYFVFSGFLYLQRIGRKKKFIESVGKIVNWLISYYLIIRRKKERKKEFNLNNDDLI